MQERQTNRATETRPTRVAVLSFLFNWPSTGGGNIHTVELAEFLGRAGYDVRHFYARYSDWRIGSVTAPLKITSKPLAFENSTWNVPDIQKAYRSAVEEFNPDWVIITDSWNSKPILAEAVSAFPYFLRQQALECICPLNNLRLLAGNVGEVSQCPLNQLSTPKLCERCLAQRGPSSGWLHQVERELCSVGTNGYDQKLRRAMSEAQAVLVLNPMIQALLAPHAKRVLVVPWGMDPSRFPWPLESTSVGGGSVARILMAGLIPEYIKGFHVLHEACGALWQRRKDFELVATGDPPGRFDEFTRFIGWVSQDDLPRHIAASDVLVMPTIAQEGLGRTTVEAMAVGRPVIASRIGGLPYTVVDGVNGLLFEPGDSADLARKIETLLDLPELRSQMGLSGRRRYEENFTWPLVIERHYLPLLGAPSPAATQRHRSPGRSS